MGFYFIYNLMKWNWLVFFGNVMYSLEYLKGSIFRLFSEVSFLDTYKDCAGFQKLLSNLLLVVNFSVSF